MGLFKAKKEIPKSLNICLIGQSFRILSRASDQGFLWAIARGLARQGHKVTVLSSTSRLGKTEITREGVRAFFLLEGKKQKGQKVFRDEAYAKFISLHKESPFHILHCLDSSAMKIAQHRFDLNISVAYDVNVTKMADLFAIMGFGEESLSGQIATALRVGYRFVTTYLQSDRKILSTSDGMFVTNPRQRVALERYYLYPDYHIYQVPYGLEVGDLSPKEKSEELRKNLGLPENSHIVVSTSDMTEVSEVKNILLAFEKVAIKKPNAYLLLLGMGPKFKDIEFEVLNLALGNRVLMPGSLNMEEMSDYIGLADAVVDLGGASTGFEPAMIEAMVQKKVLIGSEASPLASIVEDGQDGFLIRPADWQALAKLLIEIFSGSIPIEEMGERARSKVVEIFDPQKMTASVLDAYYKILENTGRY